MLLKASLKRNVDADGESLDSAEEDAPAVMLGELLDNMQIVDDGDAEGADDEDDEWEDEPRDPREEKKTSN